MNHKIIIMALCLCLMSVYLAAAEIDSVTYEWISGNPVYDVDNSGAKNIGDKVKFVVLLDNVTAGTAMIDVGTIYPNIPLNPSPFNSNRFTNYWTIKEGTSVQDAVLKATLYEGQSKKEKYSTQTLSFDAERPVINSINISPNSFNPYVDNCEINYTLSETVNNVVVKIYRDVSLNNLVRTLPLPPAEAGDNFITWWDGKNNAGNFEYSPPDADYYIHINCKDLAGNDSDSSMATVKISTLRIEIVSLDLTPTPVSPNGDGVDDNLYVNMKLMMYSWNGVNRMSIKTNQMRNLGFTAGSNSPFNALYADGDLLDSWPYAKAGFSIFNAGGGLIKSYGQELNPEYDFDKFFAYDVFSSNIGYPPDGDMGNDYETLVPFYDDGNSLHEIDYTGSGPVAGDGIFSTKYSFVIKLDSSYNNGAYLLQSGVELTGITYSEIPGTPTTIHFSPAWKGGYVSSEKEQAAFEVDMGGVDPIDTTPPSVSSVIPSHGSEITYRISSVYAYLEDNAGGSGVDLLNSDIYLTTESGVTIPGRKISDGSHLIIWELDDILETMGTYYIYVLPVDRRNNQPSSYYQYSFSLDVIDDERNLITVIGGGKVYGDKDRVWLEVQPYSVDQDIRMNVTIPFSYPHDMITYGGCQFVPETVLFKRPVTLTVYYSDTDKANLPSGITETALRIYNWRTDRWDYIGGNVDVNNMSVMVEGVRDISGYYALLPETFGGLPTELISDVRVDKPFKKNGYISFKTTGSIKDIKLLIYTLNGSFLKELSYKNGLVQTVQNAGYYNITWDLTTDEMGIVNNGIYLFRFIIENYVGDKKIVSKAIPVIK
ncbi:MAG: hypothetical protein JW827_06325 [Spirochaetes bacterium]|nr:hypothetical protein [Spirochaetota bacterium]